MDPGGFECINQDEQFRLVGWKSSLPKPYLPLVDSDGIAQVFLCPTDEGSRRTYLAARSKLHRCVWFETAAHARVRSRCLYNAERMAVAVEVSEATRRPLRTRACISA